MPRSSRNHAFCFNSLEQALAKNPETYGYLDLIAFGFPCQDISNANPKGKGIQGARSSIFFECMRIVRILTPAWVFIENVPRLLSINQGRDFALVLRALSQSGYGYVWRILDSQYFGVAQRRRRLFIIGCFGRACPPEVLFEQKSSSGDDPPVKAVRQRGLCVSATDGKHNDPQFETIIASRPREDVTKALCLNTTDFAGATGTRGRNIVAQTLNAGKRGNASFVWQDTYIAQAYPDGERKTAGPAKGLDSRRGIVIGNAVTVNVAEWIAKRIYKYEMSRGK